MLLSFSDNQDSDDAIEEPELIENLVKGMGLDLHPEQHEEREFRCSCKLNQGQSCSTQFMVDELQNVRLGFMELTREE